MQNGRVNVSPFVPNRRRRRRRRQIHFRAGSTRKNLLLFGQFRSLLNFSSASGGRCLRVAGRRARLVPPPPPPSAPPQSARLSSRRLLADGHAHFLHLQKCARGGGGGLLPLQLEAKRRKAPRSRRTSKRRQKGTCRPSTWVAFVLLLSRGRSARKRVSHFTCQIVSSARMALSCWRVATCQ